jgi:hypothetical protein
LFLDAVFTGYGSSASIIDSVLGGGSVSFDNNAFLTFDPSGDEGLALGLTSLAPPSHLSNGQLADFTAVSQGAFSADLITVRGGGGGVPEPATWGIMLVGLAIIGVALRSQRAPGLIPT